jgi:hypothetical protein
MFPVSVSSQQFAVLRNEMEKLQEENLKLQDDKNSMAKTIAEGTTYLQNLLKEMASLQALVSDLTAVGSQAIIQMKMSSSTPSSRLLPMAAVAPASNNRNKSRYMPAIAKAYAVNSRLPVKSFDTTTNSLQTSISAPGNNNSSRRNLPLVRGVSRRNKSVRGDEGTDPVAVRSTEPATRRSPRIVGVNGSNSNSSSSSSSSSSGIITISNDGVMGEQLHEILNPKRSAPLLDPKPKSAVSAVGTKVGTRTSQTVAPRPLLSKSLASPTSSYSLHSVADIRFDELEAASQVQNQVQGAPETSLVDSAVVVESASAAAIGGMAIEQGSHATVASRETPVQAGSAASAEEEPAASEATILHQHQQSQRNSSSTLLLTYSPPRPQRKRGQGSSALLAAGAAPSQVSAKLKQSPAAAPMANLSTPAVAVTATGGVRSAVSVLQEFIAGRRALIDKSKQIKGSASFASAVPRFEKAKQDAKDTA